MSREGFLAKAFWAIFNEYIKRFWIGWVHPDEVAAAKAECKKLQAKIEAERHEVEAFVRETTGLVQAVNRLFAEVMNLRFENNALKAENLALKAQVQIQAGIGTSVLCNSAGEGSSPQVS